MFRRCIARLGASPFAVFVKESKGMKQLVGLTIAQRGKQLGKMYKSLTKAEFAALNARAKKTTFKRHPKVKKPRKPSAYNLFVKRNFNKVDGKAVSRLKQIAKLWKKNQK